MTPAAAVAGSAYLPATTKRLQIVNPLSVVPDGAIGEERMFRPCLDWLRHQGWAGAGQVLLREFPWHGRHVDIAALASCRTTLAIEMKVHDNRRGLDQAARNALAFDRSYLATTVRCSAALVEAAVEVGVGILHLAESGRLHEIVACAGPGPEPTARGILEREVLRRAQLAGDVRPLLSLPGLQPN